MNNTEKNLILIQLKGKEYLINDSLFLKSYDELKKILEMPEWNEERFQELLTSTIWKNNYETIQKVLQMPEWNEEKFQGLLTSNIWSSNYEMIQKVLQMSEWNEERFQGLLTSTIWNSNYENIVEKLHLSIWNNPKYEKLLTPTVFAIKASNILSNIQIFEEYSIEDYITTNSLRKNPIELSTLLKYLVNNNIDLVVDHKLNKIITATKKQMKEKYGIDMNMIMEKKTK